MHCRGLVHHVDGSRDVLVVSPVLQSVWQLRFGHAESPRGLLSAWLMGGVGVLLLEGRAREVQQLGTV